MSELNVTELIKACIEGTAKRFGDEGIVTAEDMIPHMNKIMKKEDYPKKYMLDVSYDKSDAAKMDIYYPDAGEGPFPVFVEIHGGAWYFGQKSSIEFKPFMQGLDRGYVCVSLGYTLAPNARYPQPVMEIKRAIRYLKEHADELNIDADRIALWGGSAGAHLAALAAYSTNTGYLNEDGDSCEKLVDVLILWYGCHNFFLGKKLDIWIYQNFFGEENLDNVKEELILSNPACHVTDKAPYTLLQHGINDGLVPYEQSVYLYDVIKNIAGEDRCELDLVDKCDHADAKLFAADNVSKMFDFIDKYLK
ncbi:MAG: hypothetical protein E7266_00375 [Lachnospiraceae bacterium]|nr:hypothetical protein [Lachnospiraceae bacterium]